MVAFWTAYLLTDGALTPGDPMVRAFERAFLPADALLALSAFGAARGLLRHRATGVYWLVVAAAMSIYLALLDVAFYSGRGLYLPLTSESVVAIAINVLCLSGGIIGLRAGWLLWRTA